MSSTLPFGIRLQKIRAEIELQERAVQKIADSLDTPIFYRSGLFRGFRYLKPDWKHFCLLKAVRAVSGMNACVRLADGGFTQEVAVLIRTIVEYTTHIEFILAGLVANELAEEQKKYVEAFFADFKRESHEDFSRPRIRQGQVHKAVGAHTDAMLRKVDSQTYAKVESEKLLSNVYLTHSNYVHGRYPEVMDLFGGDPLHFHLCGMRGTPKDLENVEILETFVVTVSNALRFLIFYMGLREEVLCDPDLAGWYPPKAA